MLRTVEGIYWNDQIELTELPQNVSDRTQVLITFLDTDKVDPSKLRQLIEHLWYEKIRVSVFEGEP